MEMQCRTEPLGRWWFSTEGIAWASHAEAEHLNAALKRRTPEALSEIRVRVEDYPGIKA